MSGSPQPKQKRRLSSLKPHLGAAHSRVKKHYYKVMPNKKGHRVLVWAIFLATSSIIAGQLLYPPDRTMPLSYIGNRLVGNTTYDDIAQQLAGQFDRTKVKLTTTGGHELERPLKLAGAEPEIGGMTEKLSDYPLWLRFVPFSVLLPKQLSTLDVSFSGSVLKKFADTESHQLSAEPMNARLTLEKGKVIASAEKEGRLVHGKAIISALSKAHFGVSDTTRVFVLSTAVAPSRTSGEFAKVKTQAEAALARSIVITAGTNRFAPTSTEVTSWLVIGSDKDGNATLVIDDQQVKKYLDTINQKVGTPAGTTNVTIVDGRETQRVVGGNGKAIDASRLTTQIGDLLLRGQGPQVMPVVFVDVPPTVVYNNQYSATELGLRKYISDVSVARNMHISIQQIGGAGWSANARADESIPSASTFKVYLALMLFEKMDKDEIHWTDPILDTTVDTCFDRMTIASTNPCAVEWINQWGRNNINDFVYQHGFSTGTTFTSPEAVHTTASDLTKFMIGLNDGSLISGAHRDRLLHSLSSHPYRYGIPTGSAAKEVYDKVGFLWDYVHDSAIVHHPRGTYVMTIMSKGQSYAAIATVTREIERIMYP
jgi:vancomycin resistance protein YoaR